MTPMPAIARPRARPPAPRIRDAWKRLGPVFGSLLPGHVTPDLCGAYQRAPA